MSSDSIPAVVDKDVRPRPHAPPKWKIPYSRVSWSYLRRKGERDRIPAATPIHPRPPHYHDLLLRTRWRPVVEEPRSPDEQDLNPTLVGVRVAEDAISTYEADVGMSPDKSEVRVDVEVPKLFDGELEEPKLAMLQKIWDDQVRMLLGGVLELQPSLSLWDGLPDKNLWDLNAIDSPSVLSSVPRTSPDLLDPTDSELSVDSDPLPSTPKATKKSYAHAVFSDGRESSSPDKDQVFSPLPSKPLDASALSFIPLLSTSVNSFPLHYPYSSPSPSRSPHYSSPSYEFEFPSLNSKSAPRSGSRSLPPTLQKDENGFYNQVDMFASATLQGHASRMTTRRPSAAFLPAFLSEGSSPQRARHSSKTRELVDRLRSSNSRERPSKGRRMDCSHRSSLPTVKDAVESSEDGSEQDNSEATTSRADVLSDTDGWITSIVQEDGRLESTMSEDGWISGLSGVTATSSAHARPASSASQSTSSSTLGGPFSPAASLDNFNVPCSPTASQASTFYPSQVPYAPFAPTLSPTNPAMAAYMQMTMHMQAQQQWQMRIPVAPPNVGFSPALGVFPPYAPYAVPPTALPPYPLQPVPALYEAHAKGASMHAHW
ncbi:hypothetical protein SCP_0305790 [Sparassis crispa]|uniref:Uncharacterized protein n=1 Tax=Sparassis crispa TaxID=139825 RepID=A0A401GFC5_9APHY|nr:hypothetical protein SCP_0305790 [Sparassis crispa]GBE80859.1 hypothetical protein SCP_0305790 [Sparassis crispa]